MVRQERRELLEHLREQMAFLRSSAMAFDASQHAEAKRLAVHLRVLLHQRPPNSHALLQQLDALDRLRFLDTAGDLIKGNLVGEMNLTNVAVGVDSAWHTPALDLWPEVQGRGRSLPFRDWWTMAVIRDQEGNQFSRSDLVLAVANKDGGAHIDPRLGAAYAALSRSNSLGWNWRTDSQAGELGDPVLSSIRQIAHETLSTLIRQLPPLLDADV